MQAKRASFPANYVSPREYFAEVVHEIFDPYFATIGASHVCSDALNIVRYEAAGWFAEALYLPSDGPRFLPRLEIGVIPERFIDPRRNRIDILYMMPAQLSFPYNLEWRYLDRQQALTAFNRVRDEVLKPFAEPYLADMAKLHALLEQRKQLLDEEWHAQTREHNDAVSRNLAEAAFRAGKFAEAVENLSQMSSLSPSEQKKLEIAKRMCFNRERL